MPTLTLPENAIAAPSVPSAPDPTLSLYRLSVEQYHRMAEMGILTMADRVELLDGWLVQQKTKNPPHTVSTRATQMALEDVLPPGWCVRSQDPITLAESEPEPDDAVVRGMHRDYRSPHPGPLEVGLAVEVGDTTLATDRSYKQRIYAEAAIPVYWIVNLIDRQIEVYTDPAGSGPAAHYQLRQVFGPNDSVPVVIDGREVGRIPVRDILP